MPADLHAPRLRLRPLVSSDERLYCSLYTDPGVMRHVAPPLAPEAARRAFRNVLAQSATRPPQSRYWVLLPSDDGEALGLMACVPDRGVPGSVEVGVLLLNQGVGRGYAAEAIAALADAVFAEPTLQRLWARHARDNDLAAGLMRKLGFAPMGEVPDDPPPVRWQLARQAWLARRVFASPPANC